MFLRDSDIVFYHPLDDHIEQTQAATWVHWFPADFVPGILTSGVQPPVSASQLTLRSNTSSYKTFIGASGYSCAFWASGFLGGDTNDRWITIGHINGASSSQRDSARLKKLSGSSNSFTTETVVGLAPSSRTWTPAPTNDTGWHLFVIHFEFETSGWRHRISLDGSPWIDLGVDANGANFQGQSQAGLTVRDDTTTSVIVLDESILWVDNQLFTDQELSNLYELYNTYNTTMDQYTNTFGTSISSGINLFINGHKQTTNDISLYIPSQKDIKTIDLSITGSKQSVNNAFLYVSGSPQQSSLGSTLYIEALTPVNDSMSLYITGPLLSSNNVNLATYGSAVLSDNIQMTTYGHESLSNNIDLYIQVSKGELLHNSNVDFYHPLDNSTEKTQDIPWAQWFPMDFVPSISANGGQISVSFSQGNLRSNTSSYTDSVGINRYACAFWASGFLKNDNDQKWITIGKIAGASNNQKDSIRLRKLSGSNNNFITETMISTNIKSRTWAPPPTNDIGWHLFTIHMEYESSGWRHRISLDGTPWIDLGVDTNDPRTISFTQGGITIQESLSTPTIILDEVVLWTDNLLFTNQELSNLYELQNTHSRTMSEYSDIFGILINSGINLFVNGHEQIFNSASLYIPSQQDVETIDLSIVGSEQFVDSISLYVSGSPRKASSSSTLYITSPTPLNDNINLYTVGPLFISNSIGCTIHGRENISNNIDLYILGSKSVLVNTSLHTRGANIPSESLNMYIPGPTFVTDTSTDTVIGHIPIYGNISTFIKGKLNDINAFVSVISNQPSYNINLFTHGVPSGQNTIFYINNGVSLFINDSGNDTTVNSIWQSFVKVDNAQIIPHNDIWQSFVKGGNNPNKSMSLYINSHASGETPRGVLNTLSSNMFTDGIGLQDGDERLLSDGYFFANSTKQSFVRVHLGTSGNIPFYISGVTPIIQPSSMSSMYSFGISGLASGQSVSYIHGNQYISYSGNCFVFGIQDITSGNVILYLQVTNTGLLNSNLDFYCHGF